MKPPKYGLTNREKEVLALMVEGIPTKGIADQLFVSLPTVRTHQRSIYEKLGATSAVEVVSKTLRENLLRDHTIVRRIEFAPEHFQAGMAILSYFGTVLRQKHPTTKAAVRIEQSGLAVRMVIDASDDHEEEIIERTLTDYGLVMTGKMLPSEYLSEPHHIMQLENKLELANLELRFAEKQLDFEREGYRRRLVSLDEEVSWLREHVGKLLTDGGRKPEIEAFLDFLRNSQTENNASLVRALKVIERALIEQPNTIKQDALREALGIVQKQSPTVFSRLKEVALRISTSTAGRLMYDLIVRFPG